ncbi:MAG: cobyrinate a,c-diamide synthase [Candidatus Nitrosocaldus sp.]
MHNISIGKDGAWQDSRKHAIVMAGTSSGVGKTTITIGIMYALKEKGYKVQGFKVGPDYIDTSYHTSVTGVASRNLDPWLMGEDGVIESFSNAMHRSNAEIAVIEGVMGLYDGLSGKDDYASTAHIAILLNSPVILVLDASKAARSVAAMALGFIEFNREVKVKGVILNNVAGDRHARYCLDALEQRGIPVLGVVKRNKDTRLKERHLGLVPTYESIKVRDDALATARYVSEHINIDGILDIVNESAPLMLKHTKEMDDYDYDYDYDCYDDRVVVTSDHPYSYSRNEDVTIGVALDESFNFYYADNLEMLSRYARVVYFSPIHDEEPPECDGLYIGGGFPEVLAPMLASNTRMMKRIKDYAEDSIPIYAECGGLMYLSRSITDADGKYDMVGLIDADTTMIGRRLTLNYTEARVDAPSCVIADHGSIVRGHEFHYSTLVDIAEDSRFAYEMLRGNGVDGKRDGFIVYNTLASYMHIHFIHKDIVKRFIDLCRRCSSR